VITERSSGSVITVHTHRGLATGPTSRGSRCRVSVLNNWHPMSFERPVYSHNTKPEHHRDRTLRGCKADPTQRRGPTVQCTAPQACLLTIQCCCMLRLAGNASCSWPAGAARGKDSEEESMYNACRWVTGVHRVFVQIKVRSEFRPREETPVACICAGHGCHAF
jgi:hypothetical protein